MVALHKARDYGAQMSKTISVGAKQLRAWRLKRGLTQTEAGKEIGVDLVQISKFERGATKPGRSGAARILDVAGVAVRAWDMEA